MGCSDRQLTITRKVWTKGTDASNAIFVPFFQGNVNDVGSFRTARVLEGSSGNLRHTMAYRLSTDGKTWATPTAGTYSTTTATVVRDTAFTTLSPTNERYVQVGISAKNVATTTKQEMGTVTLYLDLRAP